MKTIKFYAVIWTKEAAVEYGIEKDQDFVVIVEPKETIYYNVNKKR